MSEKRRDSRGRILHNGEMQMSDGRYRYKYLDSFGKEKVIYSWRLDHNDRMPVGKKKTPSLREMEKQIQADMFDLGKAIEITLVQTDDDRCLRRLADLSIALLIPRRTWGVH